MANLQTGSLLGYLQGVVSKAAFERDNDRELLQRFAKQGDEAAFAALVQRHGAMVLHVAQRILNQNQDAEDVFQATFLVLARKAGSIFWRDAIANWLYQVAFRLAHEARTNAKRRRHIEAGATPLPEMADHLADISLRETLVILEEELNNLPASLRMPIVLRLLEGEGQENTARQLGCSLTTLKRRLSRGRKLLHARLARRGLSLAAALTAVEFSHGTARATTSAVLIGSAIRAAVAFQAEDALITAALGRPVALAQSVIKRFLFARIALAGCLVAVCCASIGTGILWHQLIGESTSIRAGNKSLPTLFTPQIRADQLSQTGNQAKAAIQRNKLPGDDGTPLPQGAVSRLGSLPFRHERISGFVFGADGKTLLSAGTDRILRSWDVSSGRLLKGVTIPESACDDGSPLVVLAPSGKIAAALASLNANVDGVLVFDVQSGKSIKAVSVDRTRGVSFMAFSPDESILAVGYNNMSADLHTWKTGSKKTLSFPSWRLPIGEHRFDDGTFRGYFSPDSKWFVTCGGPEPLCVFEVSTGNRKTSFSRASASAFSFDSKQLAISFADVDFVKRTDVLRLYSIPDFKEQKSFPGGPFDSLAYSPESQRVAGTQKEETAILSTKDGSTLMKMSGGGLSLAYSPDGKHLASRSHHRLNVWNASTGKSVSTEGKNSSFGQEPRLTISRDEQYLASGDWVDRSITLWNLNDHLPIRLFEIPEGRAKTLSVSHVSFSGDGKYLRAGLYGGGIESWDMSNGARQKPAELLEAWNPPYSLHVSKDGKQISSHESVVHSRGIRGQYGAIISLWSYPGGKRLMQQRISPLAVNHHAWLDDGTLFLAADPNEVLLTDATHGIVRWRLGFEHKAKEIAVSPDERLLAVGKANEFRGPMHSVSIFKCSDGKSVCEIETGRVDKLALLADNCSLVTCGNGLLRLWDLNTRQVRIEWPLSTSIPGGKEEIRILSLLAFPTSQRLLSVQADGTGLIWEFPGKSSTQKPK